MKFSVILAFVAAATLVSAESNAFRFARGLAPMAAKRGTKSGSANGNKPSSTPGSTCSTGSQKCCNQTGVSGQDAAIDGVLGLLGLGDIVGAGSLVGLDCTPVLGTACNQQSVCCNRVSSDALINFDCNAVSL